MSVLRIRRFKQDHPVEGLCGNAQNAGAIGEVANNNHSVLIPSRPEGMLGETLDDLLKDDEARKRISSAAKLHMVSNSSLDAIGKIMVELFEGILA